MWQRTPSWPWRISFIRHWKCSGALEMPKGNFLKQQRPNGVIKVVRCQELYSREICQNPQLALSLLKTVVPASCARVSSTLGSGCSSRSTLSFRGLKSTQILTDPDFFGTTTMPAHHGVGSSIREMTPRDSVRVSSSCTFFLRGKGTFLGVKRAQGLALGLSLIS